MPTIPQTIQETFQQRKKLENTTIELRKIKNHYYIYSITSKWNKQTKKPQKTAKYTGTIHPNGTYHPKKQKTKISTTQIYEYGNTQLLLQLSKDIQNTKTTTYPTKTN
jgi:hypothetical protein